MYFIWKILKNNDKLHIYLFVLYCILQVGLKIKNIFLHYSINPNLNQNAASTLTTTCHLFWLIIRTNQLVSTARGLSWRASIQSRLRMGSAKLRLRQRRRTGERHLLRHLYSEEQSDLGRQGLRPTSVFDDTTNVARCSSHPGMGCVTEWERSNGSGDRTVSVMGAEWNWKLLGIAVRAGNRCGYGRDYVGRWFGQNWYAGTRWEEILVISG